MEDAETVSLPKYLLKWLQQLKAVDVAANAHKISDERWLDLKERAASLFRSFSTEEKDKLMALQRGLGMTKEEMFKEKVDEEKEVRRIVQEMCIAERNKGRQGISEFTLHGPNGPVKSFTMNRQTGKVKPLILQCTICGVHSTKKCGGCEMFYYCGQEHQKKHWVEGHNRICKTLKRDKSK